MPRSNEEERARCRAYHHANRAKRLTVKAAWRAENRESQNAKSRERRKAQPERAREYDRQWRLKHGGENQRAWRERNAEREKERLRRWARENKPRMRAKKAARRARKVQATPAWADQPAIAAVYAECARISEKTGIAHEVDHIIPLKGASVCGLHVHSNLRIVTRTANRRKNNRLEAEFEHSWFPDQPPSGEGEDSIAA